MEEAWDRLQRAETWAAIGGMDEVTDVQHETDGSLAGFAFSATVAGTRYPGTAAKRQSEAPRHMSMDLDTSELRGTIDVRLDADAGITVVLEVRPKGFLSKMMFPIIAGAISSGLPENVERFAATVPD